MYLCGHAVGSIEDYCISAIENGFDILGFSDHGHIKVGMMSDIDYIRTSSKNMTIDEFHNIYLNDIKLMNNKYPMLKVLAGLETEFVEGYESYYYDLSKSLDYMILGVHFVVKDGICIDAYHELNESNVLLYANNVERALDSGLFKIIAHPDLFLYSVNKFSLIHEIVSKRIIESAIKNNVYLEINGNGMRVKPNIHYKYPRDEFFNIVKKYPNAKLVIGYDAHHPKFLVESRIDHIKEFIKKHSLIISEVIDI